MKDNQKNIYKCSLFVLLLGMSMYESYKSISKKITLRDVKKLFKDNEKTWNDFIRLDGQTIIFNGCTVQISCNLDSSIVFKTREERHSECLQYIMSCLEFGLDTKIWNEEILMEVNTLYENSWIDCNDSLKDVTRGSFIKKLIPGSNYFPKSK